MATSYAAMPVAGVPAAAVPITLSTSAPVQAAPELPAGLPFQAAPMSNVHVLPPNLINHIVIAAPSGLALNLTAVGGPIG